MSRNHWIHSCFPARGFTHEVRNIDAGGVFGALPGGGQVTTYYNWDELHPLQILPGEQNKLSRHVRRHIVEQYLTFFSLLIITKDHRLFMRHNDVVYRIGKFNDICKLKYAIFRKPEEILAEKPVICKE